MESDIMSLEASLKNYFGFSQFKGNQKVVIQTLLDGHDAFVIMPTGGGKSLCYQLPALISEGTAIIVSPLIALMKNQVDAIRRHTNNDSVAHVLNSSLTKREVKQVKEDVTDGKTKLLYVAPESLTKEDNVLFLQGIKISFYAIDEAHCISEWGHDFRPEYRNLKGIVNKIGDRPVIALTATATPKVQEDIQKNMGMVNAKVFVSSFNRSNLFYEVRPKMNVEREIIRFIKQHDGKSGIIYCLSRKKVEELAQTLQVNGIKALPYHAGLDGNTRAKHQDMFLMEDVDVIVATIAFGMGIDKPDVRFVIHHDIPKSLESYYQETGRAGRDDGEGICLAFYSYKDIEKLEKFLQNKHIAEQEIGRQLLLETVSYAETSLCRRQYLLHYFGEAYDAGKCNNMCDNCKFPKKKFEGKEEVQKALKVIKATKEKFKAKDIVDTIIGKLTSTTEAYGANKLEEFGIGSEHSDSFWNAVMRQSIVGGLLRKNIESYGILHLTEDGEKFLDKPWSFELTEDHNYTHMEEAEASADANKVTSLDEKLVKMLKDLRKKVAVEEGVPPFVVLQDPSINDMATQYPLNEDELKNIVGVGEGKAKRYGAPFLKLINQYVEDNDIDRPMDYVVKSLANKSALKVYIITSSDRKLPLEDIAAAKGLEMADLITEIENIVNSGTKINLDYYLDSMVDEDAQEEIYDYFMEAETDDIETAVDEFDGDYSEEEIRLMRIKFMSEMAH